MSNDTHKEIELSKVPPVGDPLGLEELSEAVKRLARLRDEEGSRGRPTRWAACADGLEKALENVLLKYELLRDRYALLKRSNSQLADEVAWLRDQCDDVFPRPEASEETAPTGDSIRRRYSDRFPR